MNDKLYAILKIKMKAQEKQLLYTMLKAAADSCCGFHSPDFLEQPAFADDRAETGASGAVGTASPALPARSPSAENHPASGAGREPPPETEEAGETVEAIAGKVRACTRCRLCSGRRNAVPGTGAPSPAVLVVGEGPGAEEDRQGLPFVGPAGKLLDKMLAAIQLSRDANCFIANIVKCRPPNNRDPLPDESAACRPFLEAQIRAVRPVMILAVGRVAAHNLLDTDASIGRLRGQFFSYDGIPLLATYHPSALLRNADLKRPAWEDLKLFKSRLEQLAPGYAQPFVRRS